ncbi:MAG: hypothetical protein FJX23_05855 [Alphaproteobacteria bacterium]|nr:hypothetical protein [Alphaproteobacteria bacterium]
MSDNEEQPQKVLRDSHGHILREEHQLSPEDIRMPDQTKVQKAVSAHFRHKGEKFIAKSIKKFAVQEDGSIDNDLADSIRKELTRRTEVSLYRDVLEPTSWIGLSSVVLGGGALMVAKNLKGRALTPATAIATVSGVAMGACMDLYRVNRRFESGMNGALSGALRAVREARSPVWAKGEEKRAELRQEENGQSR